MHESSPKCGKSGPVANPVEKPKGNCKGGQEVIPVLLGNLIPVHIALSIPALFIFTLPVLIA